MAASAGIEPTLTDSKSAVLPLDEPAMETSEPKLVECQFHIPKPRRIETSGPKPRRIETSGPKPRRIETSDPKKDPSRYSSSFDTAHGLDAYRCCFRPGGIRLSPIAWGLPFPG